jgi:hypothetical protein
MTDLRRQMKIPLKKFSILKQLKTAARKNTAPLKLNP